MDFEKEITEIAEASVDVLIERIKQRAVDQGHRLTGRLERSLERQTERRPNLIRIALLMETYGFAVDQGVPAERIPFTPSSGRGGTSLYVQGLFSYFVLRGLAPDEALQAAFATANKHAREGMPTRASVFYSSNGRRTGFFSDPIAELEDEIVDLVNEKIEDKYALFLSNIVTGAFDRFERVVLRA